MTCKYWYNALVSGDINTFLSLYNSHFFHVVDKFLFNTILSFSSKAARCPRRAELAEVEMEATQLSHTLGNNILSCLITSKRAFFFWRISSVFLILIIIYHCNCETFCSGKLHFRMGTVCSSRRRCK